MCMFRLLFLHFHTVGPIATRFGMMTEDLTGEVVDT
jgi:hypothetical protein